MSSSVAARRGRQEPRVLLRPKFDSEDDARDAVDLIESCGQTLDPFQVLLVGMTLATLDGRLAASEVAALIARQNGKGGWLEAVAIWSLFEPLLTARLEGRKNTTLWTAHELKTSDEAYARVKSLIEQNPDLSAEVVTWNGGLTGTHIIELRDGSRLVFLARSKSSGRGFSPRRIIFDEAQEFSALAFRAMMYATSAQGARRQLIYAGTVPGPENDAAIWTGVRDRGRSGKVGRLAWAEWSPEHSDDPMFRVDPEDWKARAWANPALGERILPETIDEEWEAANADIEGFLRERLSVWPNGGYLSSAIFPTWPTLATRVRPAGHPLALGIAADVGRSWLSLAAVLPGERPHLAAIRPAAIELPDGATRVPATQRALFVSEVARIAAAAGAPVGIAEKGPAAFLIGDLEEAGVPIETLTFDECAQADADLDSAIARGEVEHGDYDDLNNAVSAAMWKSVNDRQVLSRKSGEISALEAASIALYVASNDEYDVTDSFL